MAQRHWKYDNLPGVYGSAVHPHPETWFSCKEPPFKGFKMAHGKIKQRNNNYFVYPK